MAELVLKGGRIVDVDRRTHRRRRHRPRPDRGDRSGPVGRSACSTRAAAWSPPGSSTCTPTSASPGAKRPRRSSPARAPQRSVATRRSSPCRTPPRRSTVRRSCARCSSSGAKRFVTSSSPVRSRKIAAGVELAPIGEMAELGVTLFTDDGAGVQDDRLMRRALEYAGALGVRLAQHCEVDSLAEGGHMNEGAWSSRLRHPRHPRRGRGADGHA